MAWQVMNHFHHNKKKNISQAANHQDMKKILCFILSLWICTITMSGQSFTEHIKSKVEGQGTVTVHQDPAIDDMVNGVKHASAEKKDEKKDVKVALPGKKIKARGYRIQVYWGGSTLNDKTKAQYAGLKISSAFPELQAYTTFESPNWRCRVGDFVTRHEAAEYLSKIKEARLTQQNAIIVKSEVLIYPQQQ